MNYILIIALFMNIIPQQKDIYIFSVKREYIYSNKKDTIRSSKLTYNTNNEITKRVIYYHDNDNNKIKTEKFLPDSTLITTYNYRYDSNNFRIESIKHDYLKNIITSKEYVNDNKGRILRKKEFRDDIHIKTTYYSYKENSDLSSIKTYTPLGEFKSEVLYEYSRDDNNNIIEKRIFTSTQHISKTLKYKYNNKSQRTHTYTHYTLGYRTDTKRVYSFDEQGRKTGSSVYIKQ